MPARGKARPCPLWVISGHLHCIGVLSRRYGPATEVRREGAALSGMVSGYSRAIEVLDLSRRIDVIEASLSPKEEK